MAGKRPASTASRPNISGSHFEPGLKLSELSPGIRDARKEELWKETTKALSEQTLALERG